MTKNYCFPVVVFLTALLLACLANPVLAAQKERYKRTVEKYSIPDVTLVNQKREKVKLKEILNSGKPVLLDFIFATCTTICPVMSAGFSHMQKKLGPENAKVRFISISIDPEHDTPEVMSTFLQQYRAKPGWDFLTGSREDINQVMRAFDAYVSNKMSHYPLTFLRGPGDEEWVRIYGLVSTADLLHEYKKITQ